MTVAGCPVAPADALCALYELAGTIMIYLDVRALWRAKMSVGRGLWPVAFFTTWGASNLYIYPSAHFYLATVAGVVMLSMNVALFVLLARYRRPA